MNRPMAAAPNACTTSRVRRAASRPSDGAIRIPVRAANIDPISQEARRTRMALVPLRSTRFGIVDHGPHGGTEPCQADEEVEPEGTDGRHRGTEDLLVVDQDARNPHSTVGEERGEGQGVEAVAQVDHALDHEEQPDGGHDLEDGPGGAQLPGQAFDEEPGDTPDDGHGDR